MPKRKLLDLTCAECAHTFQSPYRDQKRCKVCQLATNMMFMGTDENRWLTECWLCESKFMPRKRGKHEGLCGSCEETHRPPGGSIRGTCAITGAEDVVLLHEDVKVRLAVSTDPKHRRTLLKALLKKQSQRKAEGGTLSE